MKRNDAFPSKYISKEDVTPPVLMMISGVQMELLEGDEQKSKPVMYFTDEDAKPFILNGTNWLTIEGAYGEDSDEWVGKSIELYNDPTVMFGKKRVGGVRVRIPVSAQKAGNGTKIGHDPITQFWVRVGELGLNGGEVLSKFNGDFKAAMESLKAS